MQKRGLVILLLEDQEHDLLFLRCAVAKLNGGHQLHSVHNGEEAIHYLLGKREFTKRHQFPLPDLILTDLNMPLMDGLEFLRWRRNSPRWSVIPTIMFSGSGLPRDVREAYQLGANSFFTKPSNQAELVQTLHSIFDYWAKAARV